MEFSRIIERGPERFLDVLAFFQWVAREKGGLGCNNLPRSAGNNYCSRILLKREWARMVLRQDFGGLVAWYGLWLLVAGLWVQVATTLTWPKSARRPWTCSRGCWGEGWKEVVKQESNIKDMQMCTYSLCVIRGSMHDHSFDQADVLLTFSFNERARREDLRFCSSHDFCLMVDEASNERQSTPSFFEGSVALGWPRPSRCGVWRLIQTFCLTCRSSSADKTGLAPINCTACAWVCWKIGRRRITCKRWESVGSFFPRGLRL